MRTGIRSTEDETPALATSESGDAPEAIATAALRGALASLVGGVVLEAVWGATARALRAPETTEFTPGVSPAEDSGVPCPPGASIPSPCDPRGMAAWGAVYGTLHRHIRAPTIVHGLLLGVLMHAASGAGLGPVARVQTGNGGGAARREGGGPPAIAHVAYGLATAATYEALG
jgi:hypothetical protein